MTTATLTQLPPMPVRPAAYDELVLHNNVAVAAVRAAVRGYSRGKATWAQVTAANASARTWRELCLEWWETPEGVAYRELVDAYETARAIRRAERVAEGQASVNRRAVAAVRSTACDRCFATHAGEC